MKRFCLTIAALAVMMGTMGSAAAVASPQRARDAVPSISAATRTAQLAKLTAKLSKLESKGTRLSVQQLKSLGLRPASSRDVARAKRMGHNGKAAVADIGTSWYDWQYAGVTWVHTGYTGAYYSYPWYPYYVLYNDMYICTTSGTSCQQADTYFYEYLLYYYPNGQWYIYGPSGYTGYSGFPLSQLGWGPNVYDEGV